MLAGVTRAIFENPFEYAKVKRQTGQSWVIEEIFKGFSTTLLRGTLMMAVYFSVLDSFRRHTTLFET